MRLRSLAAALSLVVVACGPDARPTVPTGPGLGSGSGVGSVAVDAGIEDTTGPVVRTSPPHGIPHYAAVVATAVSRDATTALSRDALGEVRVWPTLDGKVAAQSVPVRGVIAMRVQDQGDEILAGFAESSGSGHLVRFDRKGKRVGVADITGSSTVLHVAPLVDASGALVLFADHSLALVDRDGKTLDTLARRGVRLRAIDVVGTSSALVLLRHSDGDGSATNSVARVETTGGKLTMSAEIALPFVPLEPTRFAASGDGSRIAFTRDQDDTKAKPVAAGPGAPGVRAERVASPPPRPTPQMSRVVVIATAGGKDVTPDELKQQVFNEVVTVGFSSNDKLHVFEQSNQSEVDLVGGVLIAGNLVRTAAASVGDGLLVTGYEVSLLTQVPGGAVRYLGWQANVPQRVALAADGARAAWASARGELIIENLDGSAEIYGGLFDAPVTFVSFVGDDHVLLGSSRGTVHLVDAKTGKEVSSMAPPGPVARVEVDATTGWLAGLRPGGGVWLVNIQPGKPMPTTTYAVADGANNFALLAATGPDAPLLLTVDAKLVTRRYTEAELVAGVSAKSIRERPSVTLPRVMTRFDRRGLGYAIETSRKLVVYDGATVKQTINLDFDIQDVAITDEGARLIVMGHQTSVAEIDTDGKTTWTMSMGPGGRWAWAFSADGARLAVVGSGGGLVVDAATGERVAAGCAWRFGATSAPPLSRAVGVVPVCR